jgi:hypothetical protein
MPLCVKRGSRAVDKKCGSLSDCESAVALLEKPGYRVWFVREGACGLAGSRLLFGLIPHCCFSRANCDGASPVRTTFSFPVRGDVRAGMPAGVVVSARRAPAHLVNGM